MSKLLSIFLVVLLSASVNAESMIELGNGRVEYEVKQGGDVVVLFDAGSLSGMAGWDAIWADLPTEITAIRFSRLGEGKSESCSGQRTASDNVKEVEQLLAALNIQKPIVYVGHSLGGVTARHYAAKHPDKVTSMLMVDPANPRDVEIVKQLNPTGGLAEIEAIKKNDYAMGEGKWCFLDLIWDKTPALGFSKIGDIPVTLIASVKVAEKPSNVFESAQGRKLWGQYQSEWVQEFPRGKAVLTTRSSHFVQKDEPELVLKELNHLLNEL